MQRLGLRVRPRQGEPAYGLLNRLTLRHGLNSVRALIGEIPFAPRAFENEVLHGHALRELSILCGIDVEAIRHSTLVGSAGGKDRFGSDGVYRYGQRRLRSYGRVCCSCLRADLVSSEGPTELRPYRRFWWDARIVDACPPHRELLLATCTACGAVLLTIALSPRFCTCGHDLATIAQPQLCMEDTAASVYLVGRLRGEVVHRAGLLDTLEVHVASLAMLHVGEAALLTSPSPLPEAWRLSPSERCRSASAGLRALLDWPAGFHAVLDRLVARPPCALHGTATLYDPLRPWLRKGTTSAELDPLRAAIAEHAALRFPRRLDTGLINAAVAAGRSRVTVGWTARQLRTDALSVVKAMAALEIEGRQPADRPTGQRLSRRHSITTPEFENVRQWITSRIERQEAEKLLGVSGLTFNRLVEDGLLEPSEQRRGRVRQFFRRDQVEELISRAVRDAPVIRAIPDGCRDVVSAARHTHHLGKWLRALHDGAVQAVGTYSGADGLRGLIVRMKDSRRLKDSLEARDDLSFTDAARFLRIKSSGAISRAVACGLLHPSSHEGSSVQNRCLVGKGALRDFSARYVTVAELMRTFSRCDGRAVLAIPIIQSLTRASVAPLFSGGWDGSLFDRAKAEAALLRMGFVRRPGT